MNRLERRTAPMMSLLALGLAAVAAGCGGDNATASSAKAITAYSLSGATGTIDETAKAISVSLPFGTNVTALVATFTTTGTGVEVGTTVQVSGTTPNNFTSPVQYIVSAADGSTATYTVTANVAPSTAKAITAYALAGATGIINEGSKTVAVTVPYGTNVTALVATFTTTGASVKVGSTAQVSGTTPNNFTSPVQYIVAAADTSTATYAVTVTVAANPAKAITAYALAGASGTINEASKTVAVTVPYGTNVTALIATFTTTGASVKVGSTTQVSGTTPNNFTSPVQYVVTAADTTTTTYTVSVTVAANTAKAITAYALAGAAGTINEASKTVAVTVPFGTSVTALVATFTTTGASVKMGSTAQVSGTTPNNFTSPVQYIVAAADTSTATYTVTVTVAANPAKAITVYALGTATGVITEASKTIAVTVPFGTNVTALVATFTTTGASVKVGSTTQVSGTTPNNFTSPVQYVVTAADTTTTTYSVTVTVAANTAKAITAFALAGGFTGTVNEAAKTISVPVPAGTILTSMVATFTTTGTSVKVGTIPQVSGTTPNDFTNPVKYVVTAADATSVTYTVAVNVAGAPVNLGKAANFAILTKTGITDVPASPITGNIGTSPISGSFIGVPCTDVLTGQVFTDDAGFLGTCTSTDKLMAALAVSDMQTAYTVASGLPPSGGGLVTACPGVGAFSDATSGPLAAGVYTCAVNASIPGDLTLNGNATAVWVFQITGKLTQASGTIVHLTGGALPQNVFWQVSDVVEIGTTAHMEGVILAQTAINALTGSSVKGRLLAQTAVTLQTTTVTQP